MPRRPRIVEKNAYYHIITRGNQKQPVFKEAGDLQKYLAILSKYKKEYKFRLYCFCLMPNHIHLVMGINKPPLLSKIMKCLNLSYTLYFNSKYDKVGHLWQDRFKSKIIDGDRYLLECISYIESNPVRASLTQTIEEYPWSSHNFRKTNSAILDNLFSLE